MHGNFKESLQISVVYFLIEYFYEGESMRILLAEDDEELNRALCFQLKAQGFSVDTCLDGEEALFYGEQNIYDVILLDRMLPHMEGTAVLSRLRKKGVLAPVILITALGTLTDKVTGLNLGADDYLVKPFAFEELLARIHCVARRPRTLENTRSISFLDLTFYPEEYRHMKYPAFRKLHPLQKGGCPDGNLPPQKGTTPFPEFPSAYCLGAGQRCGRRKS